ncbi:tetratricopeptide repeat protein [Saccharopolyspora erythraea]|uniref:BTAD domain-containing putative transcriptional regulator n=1 Tax=Saccharopolyspora erythraea TaxID=1836 RepID=UPI001BA4578A|nr:BTAD domain-containing putative transcriptional regulator [Saccharopolyspora erythraea]QUH00096.1 tetratricopeptide repeat protein [Saccharopolyspora erythraea]
MWFGVLGPLVVRTDAGEAVAVPGVKVRALLACLLVRPGTAVSADRLVEELWGGERVPANPLGALQAKVSQLRKALADAESGGRDLVVSGPAGYVLEVGADAVDSLRFAALVARARDARGLAEALELWRGPAFADFADSGFARPVVEGLEEQRLSAVEDHAEARLAEGEHGSLVAELGALVVEHPLRERLCAAYMRALYRSGRQAEALEAFAALRGRLGEELGVDPGPEIMALHQRILEQDAGLTSMRSNVPAPLTGLVGRGGAVADVRESLRANRLVTLTGPGGVGKTRLALEVAGERDAWLVELGALDRADDVGRVAELVAEVLDVRDHVLVTPFQAGQRPDAVRRLVNALRDKEILLVLDNCEHVVEPVAALAEALLRAVPGLCVLATSRTPLGLPGEALHPVPPLDVPESGREAAGSSAVELFVERAVSAAPGFALGEHNAEAVAAICRRLDGLPLALELAATRVRALGVDELARRLEDRFRLLAAGSRAAPARQQTLRAVIDWSWELLAEPERVVLRRLAVHTDGCTLDAAEAVCGLGGEDVVGALAQLVDHSLVVVAESAGGLRYRLLETVAAYSLERLAEAGEADRVRLAHAEFHIDLAEQAERRLRGHDQRRWLERLDAESANLRAALDWAVRHRRPDLALRLVNALAWYWFLRGRHQEGHRALTAALDLDDTESLARAKAMTWRSGLDYLVRAGADPEAQAREALTLYDRLGALDEQAHAKWLLSFSMSGSGRVAAARVLADEALRRFRERDDRWGVAAALTVRAQQTAMSDDRDAGRDGARARELFTELGDRWGQAWSARVLGGVAMDAGDYDLAARLHCEGLRTAEELGLWSVVSGHLAHLGRVSMLRGDYARADELHRRALRLAREQSYEPSAVYAETGLGIAARWRGRLEESEEHHRHALEWNRRAGYEPGIALSLAELGFVAEQRGDLDSALALHREGFDVAGRTGDVRAVALALEGLAAVRAATGEHELAARLLGAAAEARTSVSAPRPAAERGDLDRVERAVRQALGEGFSSAFEAGRRSPPDGLGARG